MKPIFELPETREWLGRFSTEDRPLAEELLASLATVSATEFQHQMVELVRHHLDPHIPVGLYAEREVDGEPDPAPLFKQSETKPIRAYGDGPSATIGGDVGSEGVIANIITQIVRRKAFSAFSHPGPDTIRAKGIRRFILVTDFIGSGRQACRYLQAAWRVSSVRSWASRKMISFTVLAYSGTEQGIKTLRSLHCRPNIEIYKSCPTISNMFPLTKSKQIIDLCRRYDPLKGALKYGGAEDFLGFGHTGALIAFAHGAPNNCPRILTRKGKKWTPLFLNRRTEEFGAYFGAAEYHQVALARRGLLNNSAPSPQSPTSMQMVVRGRGLVMTAIFKKSPRIKSALSARTGLPLSVVDEFIESAIRFGWLDGKWRLTDSGRTEVRKLLQQNALQETTEHQSSWYTPTQLRAPR